MENTFENEHKALTGVRVFLALLIGRFFSQLDCPCVYESIYIEALLAVVGIVIFPYLAYLSNKPYLSVKFRWLVLVYGGLTLFIFYTVFSNALHSESIPDFLMSNTIEKPQEYEILQLKDHYIPPENSNEEFLKGHVYAWEITAWRLGIAKNGEVLLVPLDSVRDHFENYLSDIELEKKSTAFKEGMKDGRKAAVAYIRKYLKNLREVSKDY
ncbi:MAG: hypothetical protein NE327_13830 [Lentisphaeraceae bacterium]|nr:hypothetical protein [Lentisphaeraceae bacterium]